MKKKNKLLKDEILSFIRTFLAVFITDSGAQLLNLLNGSFDRTLLLAFATAVLRSVIKALSLIFTGDGK